MTRQTIPIEFAAKIGRGGFLARVNSAPAGQQRHDSLRCNASAAIIIQPRIAVALGQPTAVRSDDKRQMPISRNFVSHAQCSIQKNLASRRFQKIVAAHNVGDIHIRVVNYHGEMICGRAVGFGDHEIAEPADVNVPRASEGIVNAYGLLVNGKSQTRPACAGGCASLLHVCESASAGPRIH